MNGQQRRDVNGSWTNSQLAPAQYFLGLIIIMFVFAAFLWLYSPEAQDGGGAAPAQSPAAEVQEWLNSNGLRALEMDSRIVGEFLFGR